MPERWEDEDHTGWSVAQLDAAFRARLLTEKGRELLKLGEATPRAEAADRRKRLPREDE